MCKRHIWREHLCTLQIFLSVLISRSVCTRAQAHSLEGTLDDTLNSMFCLLPSTPFQTYILDTPVFHTRTHDPHFQTRSTPLFLLHQYRGQCERDIFMSYGTIMYCIFVYW